MIKIADNILIGSAIDSAINALSVGAVLNVAHDLQGVIGWENGVEYMQVGLIDGPGNPTSAYHAAILALATLLHRHKRVLICCHEGGRSLAIAIMYLQTTYPCGWDGWFNLLNERASDNLPTLHSAHKKAFSDINWKLLKELL